MTDTSHDAVERLAAFHTLSDARYSDDPEDSGLRACGVVTARTLRALLADRAALLAENARLREALQDVANWCGAYPLDVFPETAASDALAACEEAGIDVSAMHGTWARHLVEGIGRKARAALSEPAP